MIPLHLRQGQLTQLRVTFSSMTEDPGIKLEGTKSLDPSAREVNLTLHKDHKYKVHVDARTAKGFNESLYPEPIYIPKEAKSKELMCLYPSTADYKRFLFFDGGNAMLHMSLTCPSASHYGQGI